MSSLPPAGLHQILKFWAENAPDHLAIAAPERSPLSYGQLWQQINDLVIQFNSFGIGRNDRVAIALPNSPEMAVAFLASASCATCAPLNPGYKAPEFDFYLRDLQAKVLIVQTGIDSPAIAVAQNLNIPIVELTPITDAPAGIFTLSPRQAGNQSLDQSSPQSPNQPLNQSLHPAHQGFAAPEDIALVLHTSGTTSRPKIVPLSHHNLCTSAANISATLQLTPGDRCLNVMPLFHIHGLIACLLSSLKAGGSVVCSPGFYAPKFFDWLKEFQPTWYSCVPTMHQGIMARSAAHQELIDRTPLRFLRSSSAALAPAVMAEIEAVFKAPVIEAYGMTEAAHQMASNPLPPGQRKPGSVGLAAGPEVSIMDEVGNLLPLGAIGEIVIRGENVTAGYENNPTANATAYSNGWFRTGDQGYLDQDNYLFIKDRIKEIINRGGEKISPREVDEIIFSHPAIAQAVTFAMPHPQLGEEVAVAVVLHPDQSVTEREIQEFAAIHLADFKIPRRVIFLEEIPKGATGKLQRIGLAEKLGLTAPAVTKTIASTASTMDQSTAFAPPQPSLESNLEATLAEICRDVLRVESVGMGDNFFALGGDSLLAAQVINRVRSQLHRDLSIVSFWQHQTLGDMAKELAQETPILTSAIEPQTQGEYPLSSAQVQMWLLEQITPELGVYNQPLAIKLPQQVDLGILHQSLQEIIRRHSILRSQFLVVEGEPQQQILPDLTLDLPILELPVSPLEAGTDQRGRSQDLVREYMQIPFDLAQGGLIRGVIVQLDEGNQILLLVIHHIVFDGWSRGIFLQELNALYNAFAQERPSPLSELPIQYTDFALWQQRVTSASLSERGQDRSNMVTSASLSDRGQGEIAFWAEYLEGAPPLLELPIDYPRPQNQTSSGAEEKILLSIDLGKSLATLSRQANVTLFVTLLTAFGTLLHRYTGVRDLVIGCPVAGRNHLETENLIGVFINTLPLRLQIEGNPSFSDLLQQIQANSLQALDHQDLSLEKLIKVLQLERNSSHQNLFQVGFIFEPPMPAIEAGVDVAFDLARDFFVHNGRAKFDLSLLLEETPAGIVSSIEYSTDLFQEATITRMLGHLQTLLEGIVADPTQSIATLPLLTPAEQQTLLIDWNNTQRAYPQDQCIHQLFAAQVERSPDAVAVVYQDQSLTYGELNNRANQLAHYLQSLGVQPEVLVGICVDRSLDMVIGLLGILKAGGAYVPLDPVYPVERLEYMMTDAQISILLTQQNLVAKLPAHQAQVICLDTEAEALAKYSPANPVTSLESNNLAYVIYTSGSTGKPKGVMIQHRSVVNYIQAALEGYQLCSQDKVLQFAAYSFDAAVDEIFSTLSCGATLVLRTDEMLSSIATFLQTCQAWQITVLGLPTAYWHQLISALAREKLTLPPTVRLVIIGGERAIPAQVKLWQETVGSYPVVINGYGPTEATIAVTLHDISVPNPAYADREVPIGRPIQNCRVYILDQHLQPVPVGIAGELHIGGEVLARGYLNRPELTAEKFISTSAALSDSADDLQGGRLYKTGDLVRYLPDGNIEYLGRIDNQVKLRGFRIELGEIEAVLASHSRVQEAVVIVREDVPGDQRLVAYLVIHPVSNSLGNSISNPLGNSSDSIDNSINKQTSELVSNSELRSYLREKLPDYMIPAAFVTLAALPLNPNGKIDRKALPIPDFQPQESNYLAPQTEMEIAIAQIWAEVLQLEKVGAEKVGVNDNFFDLGGHSLSAIRVMTRLQENFGVALSLRNLFQFPTIEALASQLEALLYLQGAKTNQNLDTEYEEFEL